MKKVVSVFLMAFAFASINAQGYRNDNINVEISSGIGITDGYYGIAASVDLQAGILYNISEVFAVGAGTGITGYANESDDTYASIPVLVKLKYTPIRSKVSPVVRLDAGTSFNLDSGLGTDIVVHPAIGVVFGNNGLGFGLNFGYKTTLANTEGFESEGFFTSGISFTF